MAVGTKEGTLAWTGVSGTLISETSSELARVLDSSTSLCCADNLATVNSSVTTFFPVLTKTRTDDLVEDEKGILSWSWSAG